MMILFFWVLDRAGQDRWADGRLGKLKAVSTYVALNGRMSKFISPCEVCDMSSSSKRRSQDRKHEKKVIWSFGGVMIISLLWDTCYYMCRKDIRMFSTMSRRPNVIPLVYVPLRLHILLL